MTVADEPSPVVTSLPELELSQRTVRKDQLQGLIPKRCQPENKRQAPASLAVGA